MSWDTEVERERRARIQLAVAAYAYEIANKPIMPDVIFDWQAEHIRPEITTGHPLLDEFFMVEFSPMTGMWIHKHPELDGIAKIFDRYWSVMRDHFERAGRAKPARRAA